MENPNVERILELFRFAHSGKSLQMAPAKSLHRRRTIAWSIQDEKFPRDSRFIRGINWIFEKLPSMYIRDIQRAVYRFAGTKGSFSSLFIQQKFNLSILPFFPLKIYSSVYLEKKKKKGKSTCSPNFEKIWKRNTATLRRNRGYPTVKVGLNS